MSIKEIVDAKITFVSLVGKGANGKDFLIVKSDDVAPSVVRETSIIKIDEEKHLVTGIVYEPDTIDSQGEFMSAPAIEKAAHDFLMNYRNIDKSHSFEAEDAKVVESYIAKTDHDIEGATIKKGTWVMTTYIGDTAIWEQVKKGELNAYSMGGSGKRIERPDMEGTVGKTDDADMKGFFAVMKDAFKEFFTGKLASPSEVSPVLAKQDVEKAGKKISADRLKQLKAAQAALNTIISEATPSEEGEEDMAMTKEQMTELFKEQLSPITERLEKLEKAEPQADPEKDPAAGNELTPEVLKEAMNEVVKPLEERLASLENSRGLKKSDDESDDKTVKKESSPFDGLFV